MANKYREQCESNLYHITARGVAKQIIFEEDRDRRFFGKKMREYLNECDVELYAWCLMSNHVHLMVRAELDLVAKFMHKLLTSYARYFNSRHDRTGHLFQNRFDSVPITTDEQLMTAVLYIHRNPDDIPGQNYMRYEWSSYREYIGNPFVSHTEFVLQVFGGLERFVAFHESNCSDDNSENSPKGPSRRLAISDEDAIEFAKSLLGIDSVVSISSLDKTSRDNSIATLRNAGLPIHQIARITGIGRNIVQRAK
ncbi:MAG: transposase [Eggerthellaceae bacterium]|nr:transposase [Eggerthellaceae bacterium]